MAPPAEKSKQILKRLQRQAPGTLFTVYDLVTSATTYSSASQVIARLRNAGLVKRMNPRKSGRGVRATFMLTEKGRQA